MINHPCPNFNNGLDIPIMRKYTPLVQMDIIECNVYPKLYAGLVNLC